MKTKQILLCIFGTVLEWYDFLLFVNLSAILAKVFFSNNDHFDGLMLTFGVFATGYLIRPIGAIVFGHIGDKFGRKRSLLLTVILMTFATTGMGLIPLSNGHFAIIILILLRLLQGLAASGEYPGSITLLYEFSDKQKSGLVTSTAIFSSVIGIFIGSLICTILTRYLSYEQLITWGWRIPFLIGLPLGIVGYYIRKYLLESEQFRVEERNYNLIKVPFSTVIKLHYKRIFVLFGLFVLSYVAFYMNFAYIPSFTITIDKFSLTKAFYLNTLITLVYAVFTILFGFLSDIFNKNKMMLAATICMAIFSLPAFYFTFYGDIFMQFISQILIAGLIAMFAVPLTLITPELLPTNVRFTGVAVALNFAASLFGGTTPLICTFLAKFFSNHFVPAYYFLTITIIAFIILITQRTQLIAQDNHINN